MGRHSAEPGAAPTRPGDVAAPITDPRLLDRPLPPARSAAAPPSGSRSARPADAAAPRAEAEVVAPPFQPRTVRSAAPRGVDQVVPGLGGVSLLGARREVTRPIAQRYARTGSVPIVTGGADPRPGPGAGRKREAALAVAALAVVGAVSGVAALLPASPADAQTASKVRPMLSPVPGTSGRANGRCPSPIQPAHDVRHHHRSRPAPDASRSAVPSSAASASTVAPSPLASPTRRLFHPMVTTPGPSAPSPGGTTADLPAVVSNLVSGVFRFDDFASSGAGRVVSSGVLKGAGAGRTVVQMRSGTSTRAASVPGDGDGRGGLSNPTNPLWLLAGVTVLEDVTVRGTEQGHPYNGVGMTGADLRIRNAEVDDIPGDSSANPGETFAVGVNRATGTGTVDHLRINGGSGSLASAAGLAINNSSADWNISHLTTTNLRYSAGLALWQVRGTFDVHHYAQTGGARSLGAERMAGRVNLYDPVWTAGTTGHDVTYTWDGGFSGGSINFFYSSASTVPDRRIRVITNRAPGIAASVHVYIGGVQQPTSRYVSVT